MPIKFHIPEKLTPSRPPRGLGFDRKVAQFAPLIAQLQVADIRGVQEIADELNRLDIPAPSGGRFSFGTTHRVLRRGAELKLCSASLSLNQAKGRVQLKKAAALAKVLEKYRK